MGMHPSDELRRVRTESQMIDDRKPTFTYSHGKLGQREKTTTSLVNIMLSMMTWMRMGTSFVRTKKHRTNKEKTSASSQVKNIRIYQKHTC